MGQLQSLDDMIDLLRRRRVLILGVTLLGALGAGLFVGTRPRIYEARAIIQAPLPPLHGIDGTAGSPGAAQVFQAIGQRLITRENLLAVIHRHGLYADAPGLSTDQQVALLRRALRFEPVVLAISGPIGAPPDIAAVVVAVRLDDPEQAARVANDLAQDLLDQSSAVQLDRVKSTTDFFQREEARVWADIAETRARIARGSVREPAPAQVRDGQTASSLDRRLVLLEQHHAVLVRRLTEAETALRLTQDQASERFALLERAMTPQDAMGSAAIPMVAAASLASLALSFGLAVLLDLLHPVVRTAAQMERQLALRPVIAIPEVAAAARSDPRARRLITLLDDPRRPILGLPRYAVIAAGVTLCLLLLTAAIA